MASSFLDDLALSLVPSRVTTLEETEQKLSELGEYLLSVGQSSLGDVAAVGATHPSPWVRHLILNSLSQRHCSHQATRELARWLTHDYEDFIAFDAIQSCGLLSIEDALPDLMIIIGSASERMRNRSGKPVGIGHAIVLRAITQIIGSSDVHRLKEVEAELFPSGRMVIETSAAGPSLNHHSTIAGTHSHLNMRYVEGGLVTMGIPSSLLEEGLLFDWENDLAGVLKCSGFYMDVKPVTNAEYDLFAFSELAWEHTFCHPREPSGKIHIRNTWLDSRSQPVHPATGVDWFDAFAYAAWQGKRLPSEIEWQRAAQGEQLQAYPWGEVFDASLTNCLPRPQGSNWEAIKTWRSQLLAMADSKPIETTCPTGIQGSQSPFGIMDLSGNVWEWTSSAFAGGQVRLSSAERDAIEMIYDPFSYAVIKGGAWSSIPELVSSAFRGKDLLLDRHFEIGFRCTCNCRE